MKTLGKILSGLFWGVYLLLTSLYCLLAFLPYTYCALIKAPPYEWMPWFVKHHAALYWAALLAAAVSYWPETKRRWFYLLFVILAMGGGALMLRPFRPSLQSNTAAFVWSLLALFLMGLVAGFSLWRKQDGLGLSEHSLSLFPYSTGMVVGAWVALLYVAAGQLRSYFESGRFGFTLATAEITAWSVLSHTLVAVIIISILNLSRLAASRTVQPRKTQRVLVGLMIFGTLWATVVSFLENALSFEGWQAHLYAASFAGALTLFGFSLTSSCRRQESTAPWISWKPLLITIGVLISTGAVALPTIIAGGDWNGIQQYAFALIIWITLSLCGYSLRPDRRPYPVAVIAGVLIISVFSYKALQATGIFWAKSLGTTEDEISLAMERYAEGDVSFQLAHHMLSNRRRERCGDLCRILREYTDIRNAQVNSDLQLVDHLTPTAGERPNIFIFVIDSMRPDYLGVYNSKVDFTPNLDAFAGDSVALTNAYTQYAGTTLSEPAIWAGALLLHAHYLQPFHRVNSLEKLAQVDGYQLMVSYDTVLSEILTPSTDLIKLDTHTPLWNNFEVCSTVQQAEQALDTRADKQRPVLFYAQPMNVHQFANNNNPRMTRENWHIRPGFNNRIAYEVHQVDGCLGHFFAYLKARQLYDNSIIIVTSDHGDATGEFGRFSHSLSIYPEVMRVPMLVHLPPGMQKRVFYEDSRISTLTDIAPSLYYLLGHRPILDNPLFGRPLFTETKQELDSYQRQEYFLASDVRAAYGILSGDGRFMYVTYDAPARSLLFDLAADPNAVHNIVTATSKKAFDERIIGHLQAIGDFYGYRPGVESLLATSHR